MASLGTTVARKSTRSEKRPLLTPVALQRPLMGSVSFSDVAYNLGMSRLSQRLAGCFRFNDAALEVETLINHVDGGENQTTKR